MRFDCTVVVGRELLLEQASNISVTLDISTSDANFTSSGNSLSESGVFVFITSGARISKNTNTLGKLT